MFRRITALTKEGIKSVQCGRYMEAILSFRHAAECLKSLNTVSPPVDCQSCMEEDQESNDVPLIQIPLTSLDMKVLYESSAHNVFEIYTSAFMFPPCDDMAHFQREATIIVFYNIALAHHLAGLSASNDSAKHLREALRCYKIALTLVRSQECQQFDDWYTFVLGLLTNMGHIFCHGWQVEEAKSCSQHIDRLLALPAVVYLSEEAGAFFFDTLTCTRTFNGSIAPAA